MTTPWTDVPPVELGAAGETPPFVVRTVRSAILRRFRFVVGIQVACAVFVVVAMLVLAWIAQDTLGAMSALALSPLLIILLGVGFQVALWCYSFGARAAINVPLTLTADGPIFSLAQGSLSVPWAAVSQLKLRSVVAGQVLRFHLHPAVTVDGSGVSTTLSPRDLKRQMRVGLQIGSVGIDRDLAEVLVVAEQLAGRPLRAR